MKILVLDTETLGVSKPLVYELGYLIFDTADGKTLVERDYLSRQTFDNADLMATAYYSKKVPLYNQEYSDGKVKKLYWGNIVRVLKNDIEKYQPDGIYAYNSSFDNRAIKLTCELHSSKENPVADGFTDILKMVKGLTETPEYQEFCEINGYMTKHKKPRVRKTAEIVYRYLTGQTEFEEKHMALHDSRIELAILLHLLNE